MKKKILYYKKSFLNRVPNVRISRYASRKELFKAPEFMNQYDPKYNLVSQKMVNGNTK